MPNLALKFLVPSIVFGAMACTPDTGFTPRDEDAGFNPIDMVNPNSNTVDMPSDVTLDAEPSDQDVIPVLDMAEDSSPEPEAECICTDPLATCHWRTGECIREDVDCSTEACPTGFECITPLNGDPICVCEGTADVCGPFCDENEDCPGTGKICDTSPQGGVCRGALPCEDDFQCGPGKVCTYVERVDKDVCIRSGGKQDGESCSSRIECESRLCLDGVCTPFCKVNSDCGEGEVCMFGLDLIPPDSNGCVAGTCSAEGCDETQSRCVDGSTPGDLYCFGASCNVSGDCIGADCILELGTNRAGECDVPEAGEVPDCKPGEFRAWDGDPYCRLADPCWGSSVCGAGTEFGEECHDCPALYDCLQPDTNFAGRSSLSFCSRLVE